MQKYKCSCCKREFDDNEFKLTNDKNKCILHSSKAHWEYKIECIQLNPKLEYFWNIIDEYILEQNDKNENYIFENIIFPSVGCLSFNEDEISFFNIEKNKRLYFENCKFYGNSNFEFLKEIKSLIFEKCEFYGKTYFQNFRVKKSFLFQKCTINSSISIRNCDFQGNVSLIESLFEQELSFLHVTFEKVALFNYTKMKSLNFENTFFNSNISFLDIYVENISRESARLIKDSFEQQNNFIEANKFYALEMKEREKELNVDRKNGKNSYEWLVFKAHQISSNHSQDWALVLFWIFVVGFTTSLFNFYIGKSFSLSSFIGVVLLVSFSIWLDKTSKKDNEIKSIFLLVLFYLIYIYETKDIYLHEFTKVINPFAKFGDLNFIELLSKVIIAYLIYQLIISIRQNTRRK